MAKARKGVTPAALRPFLKKAAAAPKSGAKKSTAKKKGKPF